MARQDCFEKEGGYLPETGAINSDRVSKGNSLTILLKSLSLGKSRFIGRLERKKPHMGHMGKCCRRKQE